MAICLTKTNIWFAGAKPHLHIYEGTSGFLGKQTHNTVESMTFCLNITMVYTIFKPTLLSENTGFSGNKQTLFITKLSYELTNNFYC